MHAIPIVQAWRLSTRKDAQRTDVGDLTSNWTRSLSEDCSIEERADLIQEAPGENWNQLGGGPRRQNLVQHQLSRSQCSLKTK